MADQRRGTLFTWSGRGSYWCCQCSYLTEHKALHLKAKRTFQDIFGQSRKAGDEWLVTVKDAEIHVPDVYEQVIGEVDITALGNREWCIVINPVDDLGQPRLGMREVRKGRTSFFLHPGESLEEGIQEIYVLSDQEALLLRAVEVFNEVEGDNVIERKPGDLWMIKGPRDYIPNVEVEILEGRKSIPLDKNEGLYIRNLQTGELRLVRGPQVYLLDPNEELWKKELSPEVWELLTEKRDPVAERNKHHSNVDEEYHLGAKTVKVSKQDEIRVLPRDKTRAVTFNVPQNSVVQIHDYKARVARTVFGPDLVMLEPEEEFTVLSLSGGKPKRGNVIQALALLLGPDFMTDIFTVETSDHARLKLQLSYNWHFDVDTNDDQAVNRMFKVIDFVGDVCKSIASRVRGAVANEKFDEFHRNSAWIIRNAVFGQDDEGHIRDEFRVKTNNLVITNIDIQSVEPIDEQTLQSLQKSVQIAIQITTDAQEAAARQDAERIEQEANARLERQVIVDQVAAEIERKNYYNHKQKM